jgi:hypothetical protein
VFYGIDELDLVIEKYPDKAVDSIKNIQDLDRIKDILTQLK